MLESIFIGPLKLVFEIIFDVADQFIGHPGLAIIVLSLVMNILVLPLYKRADAMQEATRDTEAMLSKGVSHIKKTFSGDERMMILQTYYRQNNYKPTSALNGSVSLLLEIPFFMAAYQFLSHLDILNGVSLGPIADLSAPDGLIVIGSLTINLLPILMTLVNVVSSSLYLKGFPLKTKIQLYAMALFFLVFLYTSPSCLVFYWTLNNVFSLVKNIFYKLKNPKKVLKILTSAVGLAIIVLAACFYETDVAARKAFLIVVGALLQLPLIAPLLKRKAGDAAKTPAPNRKLFIMGALFLTVLVGLLIPSTYIAASPQEYVDLSYFHHPIWYVVNSLCLSAGTFLVWVGVFYWLANPRGKVFFERLMWILCGVMTVNYLFFGTDLGVISSTLKYENGLFFDLSSQLINLLVVAAVALVMYIAIKKWKSVVSLVLVTAIIAVSGMSVVNVVTINNSVASVQSTANDQGIPTLELSKDGQNVVVIMMDRALGALVPYIFNEKPELVDAFSGFTYYRNTVSFGAHTNIGAPALFGGYEYTPVEINKRSDETLAEKHNEALKVLPTLFADNGYEVTVCDPPYANYQWIPDLSIYDGMEGVEAYITKGQFGDIKQKEAIVQNNLRNFFCFGVMKSMPLFTQSFIYNDGQYNQASSASSEEADSTQVTASLSEASGINATFMESYNALTSMPSLTQYVDDSSNHFLLLTNETPHEQMLLQTPDYTPAAQVDNTQYDAEHADRFTVDGVTLAMDTAYQMTHYHANMASLLRLGEWFDELRANGVYDNTRIILAADHGCWLWQLDELIYGDGTDAFKDVEYYYPLLMVKDFNATEFTVSNDFMTNADVPTLAVDGVIENPVNPFTGKAINSDEKTAHDQMVLISEEWDTTVNNGNTFIAGRWASVKEDMWVEENWTFTNEASVLAEHVLPSDD